MIKQNLVKQSKDTSASFWAVVQSVIAAAFGVQSQANRERDFNQSSLMPYIVGGVIFVVGFIAALLVAVSLFL